MKYSKILMAISIVFLIVPAAVSAADISKTKVVSGFTLNTKKIIELDEKELPVTSVSILPTKDMGTIQLTVKMLEKTPYTLVLLKSPISYYLDVEAVNPKEEDIGYITFSYKVDKSWMEELGIDKDDIVMYRYNDRSWNELSTLYKGSAKGFENFESISPGFSYFAVGAEENIQITTTSTTTTTTVPRVKIINAETSTTAQPSTTTTKGSTTTTVKTSSTSQKMTTTTSAAQEYNSTSAPEEEDPDNTNSLLLGIVIMILAAISFTHFLQRRTNKSKIGRL